MTFHRDLHITLPRLGIRLRLSGRCLKSTLNPGDSEDLCCVEELVYIWLKCSDAWRWSSSLLSSLRELSPSWAAQRNDFSSRVASVPHTEESGGISRGRKTCMWLRVTGFRRFVPTHGVRLWHFWLPVCSPTSTQDPSDTSLVLDENTYARSLSNLIRF